MATLLTPREDLFPADELPLPAAESAARPLDRARPVEGTGYLRLDGPDAERKHPASFVRGVSLAGVLQMLHFERKTCVLEVSGSDGFGTLTLVNGELVDADADWCDGEEAAYRILAWPEPRTLILDGVSLFRHTINMPLAQLLVEAVRRQDEGAVVRAVPASPAVPGARPLRRSDWSWLVEALIINGASFAAVVDTVTETPLAAADETGGIAHRVSAGRLSELGAATRAARQWALVFDDEVDELVLRMGERQVLVQPLDQRRVQYVFAEIAVGESLDLIRGAIRSLGR